MKQTVTVFFIVAMISFGSLTSCNNDTAQDNKIGNDTTHASKNDAPADMPDISGWPKASQMAAKTMMDKYGKPNESTPHMLVWYNNGPWKRTIIFDQESKHIFPVDHTDVMEQVIDYKVPPNKSSDLITYDGSVTIRRTDGELSAKCDKEAANFLAINLANDTSPAKKQLSRPVAFMPRQSKSLLCKTKCRLTSKDFNLPLPKAEQTILTSMAYLKKKINK